MNNHDSNPDTITFFLPWEKLAASKNQEEPATAIRADNAPAPISQPLCLPIAIIVLVDDSHSHVNKQPMKPLHQRQNSSGTQNDWQRSKQSHQHKANDKDEQEQPNDKDEQEQPNDNCEFGSH